MGLIANLLKRKAIPEEKIDSSLQMLDRLKEQRGSAIGKYLDLMVDERNIPAPAEAPTIEDLDAREMDTSSVYTPPLSTTYYSPGEDQSLSNEAIAFAESDNPFEVGLNRFFDEFARQASAYNNTVTNQELLIGIQRPVHKGDAAPKADDAPVFEATLHTAHWGIFFFGYANSVDVHLLPYDPEIRTGLSEIHEDGCEPMLSVTTALGEQGREWYVDGKRVVREGMPNLAKELLDDLIRAANH